MAVDIKQLIRRWFQEVWVERRVETIDELMAEDVVVHTVPEIRGRAAFKEFHRTFCEAFPDMKITVELTIAEGDLVVAHSTVEGTHSGPLLGIPPSRRHVKFAGTGIARFKDGKFVEAWDQYNFLEMYGQLDALEQVSAMRRAV